MANRLLTAAGALALALVPTLGFAADSLTFDPAKFTAKTVTYNGKTIAYKAYEGLVYVRNPVDVKYQTINIYVPEGAAADAPIFLPNTVGGYLPGAAGTIGTTGASVMALSKGMVVASPGARGRTLQDASGAYTGKAPAAIVDLKAAVRYLRFNDRLIPGSSEKIISNGTSAGGALSALLGATGDNADYEPYLKALGAAEARDDVFAVSAYCPITNLDNADAAYEWLFNGINDVKAQTMQGPPPGGAAGGPAPEGAPAGTGQARPAGAPSSASGTMSAAQIANSAALKAQFPAYVNGLSLKSSSGTALSLDSSGNGSFRDYVKSFVVASAQAAAKAGTDLSKLTWVTSKNGTVTDINWDGYLASIGRMKMTSAFDGTDLGTGENNLFGTATVNNQHFTAFGAKNSTVPATTADAGTVKLMNPMNYIGTAGTTTSKYWRIRHGTADRDTSLAVPTLLATKLANSGFSVDFALPWAVPHSGDYDLDQLFAWIARVTA